MLGLLTKPAAIAGTSLLMLYYLFNPPFIGASPIGLEGNYLLVNKNLIEAVMLLLIAVAPEARRYGLDMIFVNKRNKK